LIVGDGVIEDGAFWSGMVIAAIRGCGRCAGRRRSLDLTGRP
jgi:hypothetical protein